MTDSTKFDSEPETRDETILLLEDDLAQATIIRLSLEESSTWKIYHVTTLKEAIQWLDENKNQPPLLIIADYRLPDGKGSDLIGKAKKQSEAGVGIPVIIMTAYGTEQLAVRAIKSGAIDYVTKTFETFKNIHQIAEQDLREWEDTAEADRKRVNEYTKELEQANRYLENFVSTISYDLKDPLHIIQAFIEVLMHAYADKLDEKGQNYLDMLKKASAKLVAITEDLLLLSRFGGQSIEVETIDLNVLMEEIKTELSTRIVECGGEVVVAGKLPTLSSIKVWMNELLMNLIDNGLKFNKSEKPRVEISGVEREKEHDFLFTVKDNGIGIEEENQDKIFNFFDTTQSEFSGPGFGLAICKRIITEFGGTIWVESRPGEGSTFRFTIPKLYPYFDRAQ